MLLQLAGLKKADGMVIHRHGEMLWSVEKQADNKAALGSVKRASSRPAHKSDE